MDTQEIDHTYAATTRILSSERFSVDSDSLPSLIELYHMIPSNARTRESVSLITMYIKLVERVNDILSREYDDPLNSNGDSLINKKKDLIIHSIIQLKANKTIVEDGLSGYYPVLWMYLESLIIPLLYQLPLTLDKSKDVQPIPESMSYSSPSESKQYSIVLPDNPSDNCFCNVVMVGMFMTTHLFDPIIKDDSYRTSRWNDIIQQKYDKETPWFKSFQNEFKSNNCYSRLFRVRVEEWKKSRKTAIQPTGSDLEEIQRNAEQDMFTTLEKVQGIIRDEVVVPMRTYTDKVRDVGRRIGASIKDLRALLETSCGLGRQSGHEDTADFLRWIMDIGGWQSVFLPTTRKTRIDVFTTPILDGIRPLIRTYISEPNILDLIFDHKGSNLRLVDIMDDNLRGLNSCLSRFFPFFYSYTK